MSEGLGDVGDAVYPQDAEGQIPERGHGAGSGVGADLGAVFVVGHVPYPVKTVLYCPVAADPGGEFGGGGLLGGQAGDRVYDFGGPLIALEPAGLRVIWMA
jgi:hypothetical protein